MVRSVESFLRKDAEGKSRHCMFNWTGYLLFSIQQGRPVGKVIRRHQVFMMPLFKITNANAKDDDYDEYQCK